MLVPWLCCWLAYSHPKFKRWQLITLTLFGVLWIGQYLRIDRTSDWLFFSMSAFQLTVVVLCWTNYAVLDRHLTRQLSRMWEFQWLFLNNILAFIPVIVGLLNESTEDGRSIVFWRLARRFAASSGWLILSSLDAAVFVSHSSRIVLIVIITVATAVSVITGLNRMNRLESDYLCVSLAQQSVSSHQLEFGVDARAWQHMRCLSVQALDCQ